MSVTAVKMGISYDSSAKSPHTRQPPFRELLCFSTCLDLLGSEMAVVWGVLHIEECLVLRAESTEWYGNLECIRVSQMHGPTRHHRSAADGGKRLDSLSLRWTYLRRVTEREGGLGEGWVADRI